MVVRPSSVAQSFTALLFTLVAHAAPLLAQSSTLIDTVDAVEVLRVGSIEGADALTSPARSVIGPDQTLYVHFWKELNVRAVHSDGTLGRTFSGPGDGPGEMRIPAWHLSVVGGRLYTGSRERLTWFDLESGELETQVPIVPVRGVSGVVSLFPWSVLADGTVLLAPGPGAVASPAGREVTAPVARLIPGDPVQMDTIAQRVLRHERLIIREPGSTGGGYSAYLNPWSRSDLAAPHPTLSSVVLVDQSPTQTRGSVRVSMIGAGGLVAAERSVQLNSEAAVPQQEVDRIVAHMADLVATRGSNPPSRSDARRWVEASLDDDLVRPLVTGLMPTSDGRVWLQLAGEPSFEGIAVHYRSQLWLVLGSDLATIRWVRLPDGVRLLDARGDIAWGTVTDELDVPYLVKLDLNGAN